MDRQMDKENEKVQIHALAEHSYVNGPGRRAVLWTQGCNRRCPGCANSETWDHASGRNLHIAELFRFVEEAAPVEGITITGGEPLLQAEPLVKLAERIKKWGLTVVTFTGFTMGEIDESGDEAMRRLLELSDLLVAGPYIRSIPPVQPLTGSGNQQVICNGERYKDWAGKGRQNYRSELQIGSDGTLLLTGIVPDSVRRKIIKSSRRSNETV